jgi:endonuclease/exonuclease/phosphatase family metal-dependent hydrolase
MRLVNFNIEWMNDWFVGGSQVAFRQSNPGRGIDNVDDLARRVAGLILAADPDVLTVEEGPSDKREMQLFVSTYLSDHGADLFDVFGGIDGRSQKIYALVKKDGAFKNCVLAMDSETQKLGNEWESDVNGDGVAEPYRFTRLPLVIEGNLDSGKRCKVIAMHTKSNYVQGGEKMWKNLEARQEFINIALTDRRRISSEAMRTRQYLGNLINNDTNAAVIVTGDMNDGPGLDYFELRYLTHNVIDIVLGSTFDYELLFRHSFIDRVDPSERYTVEFYDYVDGQNKQLLLDHIAVSPALANKIGASGILHKEYNAAVDPSATSDRQKRPSDHRPIYVDIQE